MQNPQSRSRTRAAIVGGPAKSISSARARSTKCSNLILPTGMGSLLLTPTRHRKRLRTLGGCEAGVSVFAADIEVDFQELPRRAERKFPGCASQGRWELEYQPDQISGHFRGPGRFVGNHFRNGSLLLSRLLADFDDTQEGVLNIAFGTTRTRSRFARPERGLARLGAMWPITPPNCKRNMATSHRGARKLIRPKRKAVIDKSPMKGKYDTPVNSESLYEILQK